MEIDSITVHRAVMKLKSPWKTAYGSDDSIETILVKMESGEQYGWGESSPLKFPCYSSEYAEAVFMTVIKVLAPLIIGKDIRSGSELQSIFNFIKGNYFAKAALDAAWWDLHAKLQRQPLWRIIGGATPVVEAGDDFGIQDSLDILIEKIGMSVTRGYKRIKLKFAPGWDLNMLKAVRSNFPGIAIHIDCNSAYTLAETDMFKTIDKFNLTMIEQPLANDDLLDHAKLQKQINTPICLDESITSVPKAKKAIEIKACKWINVKPGRVGGITNAIKIINIAEKANVPCWIGGMLESAVGAGFCLALATLSNIKYPNDIFPSDKFYHYDLGKPSLVHSAPSQFIVPDVPGTGFEPDTEQLEQFTIVRGKILKQSAGSHS
jgi:O-succinylbenzoate synthase